MANNPKSSLLTTSTTTTTTRTLSNYNRLACCYDSWSSWEEPYMNEGFKQLDIKQGDHCLDIGCATGILLERAFHAAGSSGRCVGIDLSPAMCRAAQIRMKNLNITKLTPRSRSRKAKKKNWIKYWSMNSMQWQDEKYPDLNVVVDDDEDDKELTEDSLDPPLLHRWNHSSGITTTTSTSTSTSTSKAEDSSSMLVDDTSLHLNLSLLDSYEIICGDAINILKKRNERYDCISMTFVLELFDDEDGINLLHAIAHRLSSPDATLVIVSMSSDVTKAGCMMCCYGACRKCCSSTIYY